jgi:hypothetical protein
VSAGSSSPGVPHFVAIAAPLLLAFGALGYLLLKRRKPSPDGYSKRIKPWKGKIPDVAGPMNRPPGEWKMPESRPAPLAAGRPMGRVILIDETMIRTGGLDSILEYEIGASPLTLGSATACDIVISDPEGRIGGEEARLWVQRDRLVYHKLTTLSAMATEGVTSGWQFLDTGEDIRVGPYRLTFQLDVVEPDPLPPPPKMRELWPVRSDDAEPLGASSD